MIPVAIFETIRHWRSSGLSRREIARRLNVDIKTVRRTLRKIDGGATAPTRISPGSKLDRYRDRIKERADQGRTAWAIYVELRADPEFDASYELIKKMRGGRTSSRPGSLRAPRASGERRITGRLR